MGSTMGSLSDTIIWFIGANTIATRHANHENHTIKLQKSTLGKASTPEIIEFIQKPNRESSSHSLTARSIYRRLEALEKAEYVFFTDQILTNGRPVRIYELTPKGQKRWLLISNSVINFSHLKIDGVAFRTNPENTFLCATILTFHKPLIKSIMSEWKRIDKKLGRPPADLLFVGDGKFFANIGSALLMMMYFLLKMSDREFPEDVQKKILEIKDLLPFSFDLENE